MCVCVCVCVCVSVRKIERERERESWVDLSGVNARDTTSPQFHSHNICNA